MSGQTIGGIVGFGVGLFIPGIGPQLGSMIGSIVGGILKPQVIKGPSIGDAQRQTSEDGVPRPVIYGHPAPFMGNLIDGETKARKVIKKKRQGKGGPVIKEEHFFLNYAISIGEPIAGIVRMWRNGKCVYDRRPLEDIPGWDGDQAAAVRKYYNQMQAQTAKWAAKCAIYLGDEDQLPDPTLEAIHGVGNTPYFRGTSYIVVTNDDVTDIQGAAPEIKFEVVACGTESPVIDGDLYVASYDAGGSSYHVLKTADNSVSVTGSDFDGFRCPQISNDKKKLYVSGSTAVGVVDLDTDTFTPFDGISTSNLVVDSQNTFLVTADFASGEVQKIRISDGAVVFTSALAGGMKPGAICITADDSKVYIASFANVNGYAIFDTVAETLSYHAVVCIGAVGAVLNPANTRMYVTSLINTSGGPNPQVDVIDLGTNTIVDVLSLPVNGGRAALSSSGLYLAVVCKETTDNELWIIDTDTLTISSTITIDHGIHELTYNASGTRLYVSTRDTNAVLVIDTATGQIIDTVSIAGQPYGLAIWPPPTVLRAWLPVPDADGFYYSPHTDEVIGTDERASVLSDCRDVTLRSVEEDIAARCGVPAEHLDLSALTDIIPGYLIAEQHTGAECLLPLCGAFFHDLPEVDNQIVARYRGGASVVTITDDDLIDTDDDPTTRAQEIEFPLKVSVVTQEPEADYSPIPQTSIRTSTDVKPTNEVVIQLPIPFSADQAMQIAVKMHKVIWGQLEGSIDLSLPEEFSIRIVSDPITKDDKRWLITEANFADGVLSAKAVYDRASNYQSVATGSTPTPGTPGGTGLPGPTMLAFMNLPALSDADDKLGFYVAVCGYFTGWQGAIIQASIDSGTTWGEIGDTDNASVIGTLLTALPSAPAEVIDTVNTVRVSVPDELESITEDQLLDEFNACLIGDELCQFQTATLISSGPPLIYELSILTRGRLDTAPALHGVGTRFVLLNAPLFCEAPSSWIGKTLLVRAVSKGTSEDDNDSDVDVWSPAVIQTEWAPFYFGGVRDGSDNVSLSWIGRARLGTNAAPIHSANFLGYRVSITKGATTVVKAITTNAFYYYSAAEQTSDFGSAVGTLDISIEAMNRITGPSAALTGSVP